MDVYNHVPSWFCEDKKCNKNELVYIPKVGHYVCKKCGICKRGGFTPNQLTFNQTQSNSALQRKNAQRLDPSNVIQDFLKTGEGNRVDAFSTGNKTKIRNLKQTSMKAQLKTLNKEQKKNKQILGLVDKILEGIPEFQEGFPLLGSIKEAAMGILKSILHIWQQKKGFLKKKKKKFSLPKHHIVIACCVSILSLKKFHVGVLQETVVRTSRTIDKQCTNSKVSSFLKMLEALPEVFYFYSSNMVIYENIATHFCNKWSFIPFRVSKEVKILCAAAIKDVVFAGRSPKIAVSAAIYHVLFECDKLAEICQKKTDHDSLLEFLKDFQFEEEICIHFDIKNKSLLDSSEIISKWHTRCHCKT